jgi:predicted transcriptional regulator
MLQIFHSPKKDINFYKIFSWEKIFIKSPYHKKKRQKKKFIHFLQTTHPTPPKE